MNVLEFLQNVCVFEINLVQTYATLSKNYPIHNRGRRHNGLMFTIEGTETYKFRDSVIEAPPGSVLYIPKGEEYIITLSGEKSVMVVVDFELIGECSRPFLTDFPPSSSIKNSFSKIETEWDKMDYRYVPECKHLCYKIISMLIEQQTMYYPSQRFDKIESAVIYLHQHCMDTDFRLESLHSIAGISQRYFEILFRQKYGTTPKEYVIERKIERAKELLTSEKLLIRDVALMLGYSDIYHFGKIFTKKTGYTPREYKRSFSTENSR